MTPSSRAFSSLYSRTAKLAVAAVPAALLLASVSIAPADAAGINFQFNSSTLNNDANYNDTHNGGLDPLQMPDDSSHIQTYMNGLLAPFGWSVGVSGGSVTGGVSGSTGYNADGHVVCSTNTYGCSSSTLAKKDGMPVVVTNGDYTIAYTSNHSSPFYGLGGDAAIKMDFSTGVAVSSLSFDFEIFPNIDCSDGGSRSCDVPDFTFIMTSGNNTVEKITVDAMEPGSSSTESGSGTNSAGTFAWSCADTTTRSPADHPEEADQCIGTMSFVFSSLVTDPTLYFVDWPESIGITNIDWGLPVPEPTSLALLGSGLLGLGFIRRRRRK